MIEKEIIFLAVAAFFFVASVYPKPLVLRGIGKPHPYPWLARLCLAMAGMVMLFTWYLERKSK
jgi:hypothetical protein